MGVSALDPLGKSGDGLVGSCCRDLDCDGGSLVDGSTSGPDKSSGDEEGLAGSACRDRDRGSTSGADSTGKDRVGGRSGLGKSGRDLDGGRSARDSALGPDDSSGDWMGSAGGRPIRLAEGRGAFSEGIPVRGCGGDRGCGNL